MMMSAGFSAPLAKVQCLAATGGSGGAPRPSGGAQEAAEVSR
jgi:hypothetical protein